MAEIVTTPQRGATIVIEGRAAEALQNFMDELTLMLNLNLLGDRVTLPSFTVSTLPDATNIGMIFVSDETGGAVMAFSDGTNWRRCTDRQIVS